MAWRPSPCACRRRPRTPGGTQRRIADGFETAARCVVGLLLEARLAAFPTQGGFAGARGSDQRQELAPHHAERYIPDSESRATVIGLPHALDRNRAIIRFHHALPGLRFSGSAARVHMDTRI